MGREGERAWGGISKKAMLDLLDRRECDCNLVYAEGTQYQPRRIYSEEGGVYYLDHQGEFWGEVSIKELEREEVINARLDEIKQLHSHDVYEKVPLEQ